MTMREPVNVTVIEEKEIVPRAMSWRAILAGIAVALVVQLILSLLGAGIGLAFVDPTRADNPDAGMITLAAMIWWTLSGVLAAWAGGVTAGRLCGLPGTSTAAWHGLVTWAATVLVVFYLTTTAAGSLIGGAFGTAASVVGSAAGTAAAAAPSFAQTFDPFASVQNELDSVAAPNDPSAARDALQGYVRAALAASDSNGNAAMDRAAQALAQASGTTPDAARQRLTEWKTTYDNAIATAEQQAREAADKARKAASGAAILSVIALVFGALAGWFGGWNAPVPEAETPFGRLGRRVPT